MLIENSKMVNVQIFILFSDSHCEFESSSQYFNTLTKLEYRSWEFLVNWKDHRCYLSKLNLSNNLNWNI